MVLLTLDGQLDERDRMYEFMQSIDLSVTLAQLDIHTQTDIDLLLDKAMSMNDIKTSPYVITRELVMDAIEKVEALAK